MLKILKHIFKIILPPVVINIIQKKRQTYNKYKFKCQILKTLLKDKKKYELSEIDKIVKYLKYNPLSIFPYNFIEKYKKNNINVFFDEKCSMHYVLQDNKKLYFRRDWDRLYIQEYFNGLLFEQDIDSPHRYEYDDFCVKHNDVVVDVGAAEGNFSLSIVEKVNKLFLFEVDKAWIDALKMTFMPWKEKVFIVNKYVSNNSNESVKLDDFFYNVDINFLKVDIEGAEMELIEGAENILLTQNNIKAVFCTYHKQDHAEQIKTFLNNKGYSTSFSKGYMIFYHDALLSPPYLRRGLIRAEKHTIE
jgi:hypothetical protein